MRRLQQNWQNPLGLVLGFVHAVVRAGVLLSKEPLGPPGDLAPCPPEVVCFDLWDAAGQSVVASRSFHFHYESALVKVLMLADLPANVVLGTLLIPVSVVLPRVAQSNLPAAVWVLGGSIQWWALGTWAYCVVKRC